jgi:hypothetical protein
MRGLSSDTAAKVNAVGVVILVVIAGAAAAALIAVFSYEGKGSYTVTVSVEAMEVSSESGHVYNVQKDGKYFNPETGHFDRNTASNKAVLYMSATMGSKTNYSDNVVRNVKPWPIESPEEISGYNIGFKVTTAESSMKMSVFLLLKGSSNDASEGSIIDIYDEKPGESGISLSVDMKDHTETFELKGNPDSTLKGYLKITVTVKSA